MKDSTIAIASTFGSWLRQRRKALDLTQETLADRVGCSPETIRKIETGARRASRQVAELLAEALDLPLDQRAAFVRLARLDIPDKGSEKSAPKPALPVLNNPVADADSTEQNNKPRSGEFPDGELANPYKGLRAFEEADTPYFFGREALVSKLLSRFDQRTEHARFLAVVGPSGCGKSSLVRAGLIPALRARGLPRGDEPLVVSLLPGASPDQELRSALSRLFVETKRINKQDAVVDKANGHVPEVHGPGYSVGGSWDTPLVEVNGPWSLSSVATTLLALRGIPEGALLVFIDQFEEIFTLAQGEFARTAFLTELNNTVADSAGRVWIVVTLRADFYDRPLLYPSISKLFAENTVAVGPMSLEELRRAVVAPAEKVGLHLEADLVSLIQQDVIEQPGALPLMEYALTELFERKQGRLLTLQAYEESGGVRQAISARAEAIFSELSEVEKEEARQLFLRLVTLGDEGEETRRRALRAELASAAQDEELLDQVMDLFGRYRLLTFDRDPTTRRPTVEVAHEALIRNWGRLREWLDASRSDLRVHRQLASTKGEWLRAGRDASFLARGSRLAQFQALAEPGGGARVALNREERDYLQASIVHQNKERAAGKRRMRLAIGGLVSALAVISLFAFLAVVQAGIAAEQAHAATEQRQVAFSREVAAEAISQVKGDSMRSLLLALEAARIAPTDEAESAIRQALLELDPAHILYQGHEASGSMDFSPDSNRAVIAEHNGPVRIRDVRSGDVQAELDHNGLVDTIQFSPDSKWIAGGSRDRLVWLWNGLSGQVVYSLTQHEAPIFSVAFSPDSKRVVSGSADGTARVWDALGGKQVAALLGHSGPVNSAQFSPDGEQVVTASEDKTARIWDAATGRQLFELTGHESIVNNALFSPDGKWVVTAGQDNTARLWDASTGKAVAVLAEHTDSVNNARFSHDSKWVVTASNDGTTRLWDVAEVRKAIASGQHAVSALVLQSGPAMDARFSPDDRWVVSTCSSPGGDHLWVARVFAIDTGKPVAELGGHDQVSVVAYARPYFASRFSPDGKWLVVADGQAIGRVLRWEFYQPLDYLLTIAPDYTKRQLTCEERQIYLHAENACVTPGPTVNP